MPISEINSVIQGTRGALELIKILHGISNSSELLSAVNSLQMQINSVLSSEFDLQERIRVLVNENSELKKLLADKNDWKSEKDQYTLFQFSTGALAYALKKSGQDNEPAYYLCAACTNKNEKSILQPNGRLLYCPFCKESIVIQEAPPLKFGSNKSKWIVS